jgi:4-diphosphocytidyl-2-C-methyl-D-erythritol kinase
MTAVVARAPAKINVHLAVGPLRPDGFHGLRTVYLAVSLFDTVTAWPGDGLSLTVTGEGTDGARGADRVPTDRGNLVWRAAELLAEAAGVPADATIEIAKSIPAAAGLAGGSADAAAALVGLSALWKLDLTRDELAELAAQLGSDVTFALYGGTALGTGRGERIVPVLARHPQHWVIALHRGGLATPSVFRELDRLRNGQRGPQRPVEPVLEAIAGGDPRQLALSLGNDLQAAAVSMAPDLRRTLRAGVEAGALAGIVSGSGPTCAFLCADADAAIDVATELAGVGVCRTVRLAHGPVPGARIVDQHEPPSGPPPLPSWPPEHA